jgi:ribosome-binding factor A
MPASVRSARLSKLILRVVAGDLERSLHDPRLKDVTITEVRVTGDLQNARIFWTQLGQPGKERGERQRAARALEQAKGRLRSHVGRVAGLRLTPVLEFVYDEVPQQAHEIDEALDQARQRDAQLDRERQGKAYAGDSDPYRHDDDETDISVADTSADDDGTDESNPATFTEQDEN